jgi:hypothetical protein
MVNDSSAEYTQLLMVHPAIAFSMLAVGAPLCLVRMWWIWWQSMCGGCGLQRNACDCGPGDHMMRPRR